MALQLYGKSIGNVADFSLLNNRLHKYSKHGTNVASLMLSGIARRG